MFVFLVQESPKKVDAAIVPFNPDVVEVPDGVPEAQTYRSVVAAFVIRGWCVTKVSRSSRYIDAEYPVRRHVGRVRTRIGDKKVDFDYRESENLDQGWIHKVRMSHGPDKPRLFKKPKDPSDTEAVHRNYLSWVNKVARTLEGKFLLQIMD